MPISARPSSTPTYPTGAGGSCTSSPTPMPGGKEARQMTPHLQQTISIIVTAGIAWLMTRVGLAKHGLEERRRRRACPACGRQHHLGRCTND